MIPRILPNDDPGHAPQRFMHLFLIDNAETQPMAMCRLDMRNVARSYVMYHVAEYALARLSRTLEQPNPYSIQRRALRLICNRSLIQRSPPCEPVGGSCTS
jgi:hypothetical protein